jgi:hypothetical protein
MGSQAEIFRMLHLLSGSPLTVMFAIAHAPALGQTADLRFLQRAAGLSDKTTTQVLQTLEWSGMITRQGSAWVLSADGLAAARLLSQFGPTPTAPEARQPDVTPPEIANSEPVPERNFSGAENSSDLDSTRSSFVKPFSSSGSRDLKNLESRQDLEPLPPESREAANRKNSGKAQVLLNLAMLDRYQIREPARSRLAALPHVTPEMVREHCETAREIPLAIYRIENNWKPSKLHDSGPPG